MSGEPEGAHGSGRAGAAAGDAATRDVARSDVAGSDVAGSDVAGSEVAGSDAAKLALAGSAGQQARILILEDQAWDAELARRLLTEAGLNFTSVVVDTRTLFTEQLTAFEPDVILSDYHLAGFTGEDALKIVQEQCPQIPFIIWSGVLGDDAAVELIKQGAADYVLKDRPARLPSVIRRALDEVAQREQLAELEGRLAEAQRLASLGQLAAAEQAVSLTRQLLAIARQATTAAGPAS